MIQSATFSRFLLVAFLILLFAGNYNSYVHQRSQWEVSTTAPGPRFTSASNVTVFTYSGATTHIDCAVEMVSQDTVISWVRRTDLHILTINTITYTADRRFSCSHNEEGSVWRLTIQAAGSADSGLYECQMSTEPKISKLFLLNVTEATSKIQAGPSVYVKSGSLLNLTCVLTGHLNPATHILWYHNTSVLNTAARGGVSIVSDKVLGWSNLILSHTTTKDSGSYSCHPSNARHHSVQVNIIKDGDLSAGGLTGSGGSSVIPVPRMVGWTTVVLAVLSFTL